MRGFCDLLQDVHHELRGQCLTQLR